MQRKDNSKSGSSKCPITFSTTAVPQLAIVKTSSPTHTHSAILPRWWDSLCAVRERVRGIKEESKWQRREKENNSHAPFLMRAHSSLAFVRSLRMQPCTHSTVISGTGNALAGGRDGDDRRGALCPVSYPSASVCGETECDFVWLCCACYVFDHSLLVCWFIW